MNPLRWIERVVVRVEQVSITRERIARQALAEWPDDEPPRSGPLTAEPRGNATPIVSIWPSGIGGPYQREVMP